MSENEVTKVLWDPDLYVMSKSEEAAMERAFWKSVKIVHEGELVNKADEKETPEVSGEGSSALYKYCNEAF